MLFYEGLKETTYFYRDEKGSVMTTKESLAIRESGSLSNRSKFTVGRYL